MRRSLGVVAVDSVGDDGWRFGSKDNVLVMLGTCPDAIPASQLGEHSYFACLVVDDVDAVWQRSVASNRLK